MRPEERGSARRAPAVGLVNPERPIKQPPYLDRARGDALKRRRLPENRRYMWMREDHDARRLWDGPVNPDRVPIEDWRGVTEQIKAVAREMGADRSPSPWACGRNGRAIRLGSGGPGRR